MHTVLVRQCQSKPSTRDPQPVMCFPPSPSLVPSGLRTTQTTSPAIRLEGLPQAAAWSLRLQTGPRAWQRECRRAAWHRGCSPWEDGGQPALGPGSWLRRSELTEVYLFIICLGRMGENQIQRAVLAAVGKKKGMSVSPERIPRIVALAP